MSYRRPNDDAPAGGPSPIGGPPPLDGPSPLTRAAVWLDIAEEADRSAWAALRNGARPPEADVAAAGQGDTE